MHIYIYIIAYRGAYFAIAAHAGALALLAGLSWRYGIFYYIISYRIMLTLWYLML